MTYVDGFVFVISKKNREAYKKMAQKAGKIWKKHGALHYFECEGDDMHPKMIKLTFPKLTKLKPGERAWFSFIMYKSKAHRDSVNAKVMKDPAMNDPAWQDKPMPFDMNRMSYGGFRAIVDL